MHDHVSLTQRYERFSDDALDVAVSGRIFLLDESNPPDGAEANPLKIAHAVCDGRADFNDVYGFFRIAITDKVNGRVVFFGDNAASQVFFYDAETCKVSDSLLNLARFTGEKRSFNVKAAAQFLAFGGTVTNDTLVEGIMKTDADMYYIMEGGKVTAKSKGLLPISEKYTKREVYDFVKLMIKGLDPEKMCARVTGGTDSRVVLAAVLKAGGRPHGFISGYEDNPDVAVAKEIGQVTGLDVTALHPGEKSADWINQAFAFSDGMQDVVGAYRQLVLTKLAAEKGTLWFGGVGGEFYKNHFYKPVKDRMMFHNATAKDAVDMLFIAPMRTVLKDKAIGDAVRNLAGDLSKEIYEILSEVVGREKGNLAKFNMAGIKRMQGFTGIANSIAGYVTQSDPLMDRHIIRNVSYKNPFALSMAVWNRKQVRKNYPALSNIRTDQGYTLSLNPVKLNAERIRKGLFWSSRVLARVRKKLGLRWKDITAHYWDNDYSDARKTTYWGGGLTLCERLRILKAGVKEEDIPMSWTGWIILFGMMEEYLEKL